MEARVEAAGPECIVPGLAKPVRLLGLKVCVVSLLDFLGFVVVCALGYIIK